MNEITVLDREPATKPNGRLGSEAPFVSADKQAPAFQAVEGLREEYAEDHKRIRLLEERFSTLAATMAEFRVQANKPPVISSALFPFKFVIWLVAGAITITVSTVSVGLMVRSDIRDANTRSDFREQLRVQEAKLQEERYATLVKLVEQLGRDTKLNNIQLNDLSNDVKDYRRGK